MPHGGVEHLLMQRRQSRENAVRSYASGGSVQATAQKLQGMGRNGDTILAHINPEEAALLKRMGGSGKINPNTGLMSFDNPSMGAYDGPKTDTSPANVAGGSGNYMSNVGSSSSTPNAPGGNGRTDTSGGPGSAPGGDGSKTGSQGSGAGAASRPSGGITDIRADLPVEKATPIKSERAKYIGATKIPDNVKLAFDRGMIPIEGGLDAQGKPLTSEDNAHGIAQVTDTTAPEAAADAGLTWDKNKYLTDTNYNYSIGLGYFNKLVKQFGNTYDAAGAYNAGPGTYKNYLAGKRSLPTETVNYQANFQKAMADPNAGYRIPDPQAGTTGVAPKPVNITQQDVGPATERSFLENVPGYVGGAILGSLVPPIGLYDLIARGTNFVTGKQVLDPTADMINNAIYGKGTTVPTASPSTAPTAKEYEKYGAAGDGSPNTDPMKMYKEIYGGGSDKPLLGIESLDRSPLVPGIDPSLPSVPPDATDPSVPLFDYNYSNFGITGAPTAEYKYSNFGL